MFDKGFYKVKVIVDSKIMAEETVQADTEGKLKRRATAIANNVPEFVETLEYHVSTWYDYFTNGKYRSYIRHITRRKFEQYGLQKPPRNNEFARIECEHAATLDDRSLQHLCGVKHEVQSALTEMENWGNSKDNPVDDEILNNIPDVGLEDIQNLLEKIEKSEAKLRTKIEAVS